MENIVEYKWETVKAAYTTAEILESLTISEVLNEYVKDCLDLVKIVKGETVIDSLILQCVKDNAPNIDADEWPLTHTGGYLQMTLERRVNNDYLRSKMFLKEWSKIFDGLNIRDMFDDADGEKFKSLLPNLKKARRDANEFREAEKNTRAFLVHSIGEVMSAVYSFAILIMTVQNSSTLLPKFIRFGSINIREDLEEGDVMKDDGNLEEKRKLDYDVSIDDRDLGSIKFQNDLDDNDVVIDDGDLGANRKHDNNATKDYGNLEYDRKLILTDMLKLAKGVDIPKIPTKREGLENYLTWRRKVAVTIANIHHDNDISDHIDECVRGYHEIGSTEFESAALKVERFTEIHKRCSEITYTKLYLSLRTEDCIHVLVRSDVEKMKSVMGYKSALGFIKILDKHMGVRNNVVLAKLLREFNALRLTDKKYLGWFIGRVEFFKNELADTEHKLSPATIQFKFEEELKTHTEKDPHLAMASLSFSSDSPKINMESVEKSIDNLKYLTVFRFDSYNATPNSTGGSTGNVNIAIKDVDKSKAEKGTGNVNKCYHCDSSKHMRNKCDKYPYNACFKVLNWTSNVNDKLRKDKDKIDKIRAKKIEKGANKDKDSSKKEVTVSLATEDQHPWGPAFASTRAFQVGINEVLQEKDVQEESCAYRVKVLDSGSEIHALNRSYVPTTLLRDSQDLIVNGFSGKTVLNKEAKLELDRGAASVTFMVGDNIPSVVSLGRLVQDEQHDFEWKSGQSPKLIDTRNNKQYQITVKNYVPRIGSSYAIDSKQAKNEIDIFLASVEQKDLLREDRIEEEIPPLVLTDVIMDDQDDVNVQVALSPSKCFEPPCEDNQWVDAIHMTDFDPHTALHNGSFGNSCQPCKIGKFVKRPQTEKGVEKRGRRPEDENEARFFRRTMMDVTKSNTVSIDGYKSMITLKDNDSNVLFIRLSVQAEPAMEEAVMAIKSIMLEVRLQPELVRTDNGGCFQSDYHSFLQNIETIHEYGRPHDPKAYSRMEIAHRALNQSLRTLLYQAGLPISFWSYCADYLNWASFRFKIMAKTGMTGYHFAYGKEYETVKLFPFGCRCVFVDYHRKAKYAPTGAEGIILGRAKGGFLCLNVERYENTGEIQICVTIHVQIYPQVFPAKDHNWDRYDETLMMYEKGDAVCTYCRKIWSHSAVWCRKCYGDEIEEQHAGGSACMVERCLCRGTPDIVSDGPSTNDASYTPVVAVRVTEVIKGRDIARSERGRMAIKEEVDNIKAFDALDFENVAPLSEVRKKFPEARYIRADVLFSIKHVELGLDFQRIKARLIAFGNRVWQGGFIVDDKSRYEKMIALQAARVLMILALFPNKKLVLVDYTAAYLQAKPSGGLTFLILGKVFTEKELVEYCDLPSNMINMTEPCLRMCKAFYGTRSAGADFANHQRKIMIANGYAELKHVEMNMFKKEKNEMLSACGSYVDDSMFVGDDGLIDTEVNVIKTQLKTKKEPQINGGQYLGWTIHAVKTDDPYKRSWFLECVGYIDKVLEYYRDVSNFKGSFKKASTPFKTITVAYFKDDKLKPGKMAKYASTFNGLLLWLCRIVRFDIVFTVAVMSRFNCNTWPVYADERLHYLMRFLNTTREHGLLMTVDKRDVEQGTLRLVAYVDSDHGGCPYTMKSTMCCVIMLKGEFGTNALIDVSSKLSPSADSATASSELRALNYFLKVKIIPTLDLLESLNFRFERKEVRTDSSAAKDAVDKGYSIKLRYLAKFEKLNIAEVHELMNKLNLQLALEGTNTMLADLGTKDKGGNFFADNASSLGITPIEKDRLLN